MERVEYCANDTNLDVKLQNLTLVFRRNALVFKGTVFIERLIDKPMEFDISLIRCKNVNNDCQTFQNTTVKHMCEILYETRLFGANFFKRMTPYVKCPLKAGLYKMNDAEINLDFLSTLPIEGFFWNVIANFYVPDKKVDRRMIACISGHVRVFQSGFKRNAGSKRSG